MKIDKELTPDEKSGGGVTRGFRWWIRRLLAPSEPVCPRCGPRGELVHVIEGDGAHCNTCDTPILVKPKKRR